MPEEETVTIMNGEQLSVGCRVICEYTQETGTVIDLHGPHSMQCYPIDVMYDNGVLKSHPYFIDLKRIYD